MKFDEAKAELDKYSVGGLMTENEQRTIFRYATKSFGDIVEIGAFVGYNTYLLAKGAPEARIIVIDPMVQFGTTKSEKQRQLGAFTSTIKALGINSRVDLRIATSRDVAKQWASNMTLLVVDGDHAEEECLHDIEEFGKHVIDGGFILVHDYDEKENPGVVAAVDKCSYKLIDVVDTLAVLSKTLKKDKLTTVTAGKDSDSHKGIVIEGD